MTGFVSYGFWSNDEPLQPFTINPTLPQLTPPRSTAKPTRTSSRRTSTSSRGRRPIGGSAHGCAATTTTTRRRSAIIPQFINYDTSVTTSSTGGPELFAHSRTNFDADATWTGLLPFALTAGYTHNSGGYDFRIFESTRRERVHAESRRGRLAVGDVPRALRAGRSHGFGPR